MKFFARMLLALAGIFFFGFGAAGSAFAADPELWTEYGTSAYFIADETDYRDYAFDALRLSVGIPLSLTPTDGKIFLDGNYQWITEDEKYSGNEDAPDGFALQRPYSTSTVWSPSYQDRDVLFYGDAETGLPGQDVSVELRFSGDRKETYDLVLPDYRAPGEQLRTFVPYVRLADRTFEWHFMTKDRTNAIEVPYAGTFDRISVVGRSGNVIYDKEVDRDFSAGERPEGRVDVPDSVANVLEDLDFDYVQVDYTVWESGRSGPASHYIWYYFPAADTPDDSDGSSGCNAAGLGLVALLAAGTALLRQRRK